VAGASKTITVSQAGGFVPTAGTLSGTLTVDLSGAAGVYTQTGLTIAADAILNVTTGTGAITYTALTKTGTGAINITMAGNANIGWTSANASRIDTLTINTGKTAMQTANIVFSKLAGSGALEAGAWRSDWLPSAAGDWDFTGITVGSHALGLYASPQTSPLTITNAVNIGSRVFNFSASISKTLTIPGLACGDLAVNSVNADNAGTLIITGNSSGAAIALGAGTNRYGIVTFGSGFDHTWTGAISYGGTGTANAITFGGRVKLGGNVTLAGIVTNFGSSRIDFTAAGKTINGLNAGTITNTNADIFGTAAGSLVVTNTTNTSAAYLRVWNANVASSTGNTNVQVLPATPDQF